MAGSSGEYPIASFFFRVEIDGVGGQISFQEVTGLEESAEVLEYRFGTSPVLVTQKRAGLLKTSTVTMKRGIFHDKSEVADLLKELQDKSYHPNEDALLSISVTLLDVKEEEVMSWVLTNAFPIKISGPTLKSDSNEVAVESIEFAHEGIKITSH